MDLGKPDAASAVAADLLELAREAGRNQEAC
jgi:hypothetical protein